MTGFVNYPVATLHPPLIHYHLLPSFCQIAVGAFQALAFRIASLQNCQSLLSLLKLPCHFGLSCLGFRQPLSRRFDFLKQVLSFWQHLFDALR